MPLVTVSEITAYLKELFQIDPVLADIWVRGEASNISRPASGHLYFSLKDLDASLRCVCFKQQARYLSYLPDDGDAVLAHGRIGIYEATGQYQLYIDLIQSAGVGLLAAQFERLRLQLEREGLFDEARKRPLPVTPRCIGVVTSASGAVWHDIQTVVARRYPLTSLLLAPAAVQGSAAPAEIVRAIAALQADGRAEVIIVGRGGGSAEDLAPFNDEAVVRAIFACRIPVVSAVGHETDITLADLVADVRAPTPSAAAELCTPDIAAISDDLATAVRAITALIRDDFDQRASDLDALRRNLQRLSPILRAEQLRQRIDERTRTLTALIAQSLIVNRERLGARRAALAALNPAAVLDRGFALVTDANTGAVVRHAADGYRDRAVRIRVADGAFGATATGIVEEQ
ncbi:MAG: exodeoxyribonuclease VII large subunit [Chloroflexota bacterium]|nr:exodeoxyribonuclease VII large subunit [Chloroflexota bacterium]